jgi:hypothetical protein
MSNNTTEQALIQIERNLEKLESARNQVLNVTQSGQQIVAIMIDLVERVRGVYDIINHESESFVDGFANNQKKLDDNTSELIKRVNASTALFLEHLNVFSASLSETINKKIGETLSKTVTLFENQEVAFKKHISNLDNFNNLLEGFKKSIREANFTRELSLIEDKIQTNETKITVAINESLRDLTKQINVIQSNKLFIIEQNHLFIEKINENDAKHFTPIESKLEGLGINQKTQLEQSGTLVNLFSTFQDQFLNLQQRNNEQIKILINKQDSSRIMFYITWFLVFLGFMVCIFLINHF